MKNEFTVEESNLISIIRKKVQLPVWEAGQRS